MGTAPSTDLLSQLQRWFLSQCNGDWEHGAGVSIDTLDNPGWKLKVNLEGTELESRPFVAVEYGLVIAEPNNNWMICRVVVTTFEGHGGPEKLAEIIAVFLNWAHQA